MKIIFLLYITIMLLCPWATGSMHSTKESFIDRLRQGGDIEFNQEDIDSIDHCDLPADLVKINFKLLTFILNRCSADDLSIGLYETPFVCSKICRHIDTAVFFHEQVKQRAFLNDAYMLFQIKRYAIECLKANFCTAEELNFLISYATEVGYFFHASDDEVHDVQNVKEVTKVFLRTIALLHAMNISSDRPTFIDAQANLLLFYYPVKDEPILYQDPTFEQGKINYIDSVIKEELCKKYQVFAETASVIRPRLIDRCAANSSAAVSLNRLVNQRFGFFSSMTWSGQQ